MRQAPLGREGWWWSAPAIYRVLLSIGVATSGVGSASEEGGWDAHSRGDSLMSAKVILVVLLKYLLPYLLLCSYTLLFICSEIGQELLF